MLKRVGLNIGTSPLRYIGGAQAQPRQMWSRTERLNQAAGTSQRSGAPYGHLAPSSWILPNKPGAMSSTNEANIVFVTSGNGAQGLNATASSSILFTTAGSGQAVASAVGNASITFTTVANGNAPLNAAANATIAFTTSATLRASAAITGSATVIFTSNLTTYGIGNMIAVPISQELTADQIAIAVWGANALSNDTVGSMGEKLNDAGGAANPWTEVIESGFTAAEILRLLAAVAAGDGESLNKGVAKFKSLDGLKDRVIANLANGNRDVTQLDVT